MASKTVKSSPRTVASAKRSAPTKSGSFSSFWKPATKKSTVPVKSKPPQATPTVSRPATKTVAKAPAKAVAPVIPAGMPRPVAQVIGAATAKKGGQIAKQAAVQTKAPSAYTKSLPAAGPTYTKTAPPVAKYTKTAPTTSLPGGSRPGSGAVGTSGGGTRPVTAAPVKPAVVAPVKPAVTAPVAPKPVTTPATGQTGTFNTVGGRGTSGSFARKRQSRGPQTGLSMTPQMLMRLAGQRITNTR